MKVNDGVRSYTKYSMIRTKELCREWLGGPRGPGLLPILALADGVPCSSFSRRSTGLRRAVSGM